MPGRATKRPRRSEAQMVQKRQGDRLKHKANRAEQKLQLERIENDVSWLRSSVGHLVYQLRLMHSGLASPAIHHQYPCHDPSQALYGIQSLASSQLDAAEPLAAGTSPEHHPSIASLSPVTVVDCRCGIEHETQSDCLEYSSFTVLYQAHVALWQNPLRVFCVPRDPSLSNLLLNSIDDNPVTMILGSTLGHFEVANIETLFGCYFLAYRLLRWRLFPDPGSFNDVPELMRPTSVQESLAHPVCIDYMPWPGLRDYICLNQNRDSRHSVDCYLKSVRLHWPTYMQLLCRRPGGDIHLNAHFERIVSDVHHWRLVSPWADTFPHLLELTTL